MEPKRVSPMEGLLNSLSAMANGTLAPKERFNTEVGRHIVVDTCLPGDTRIWETGIERNGEPWIIVEQYPDKDAASKGHNHWVKLMTEEPDCSLQDIDLWSLDNL